MAHLKQQWFVWGRPLSCSEMTCVGIRPRCRDHLCPLRLGGMEMVVMELRVLERNSRLEIGQGALRKLLEYQSTSRVFQRCDEETWRRKPGSWTGVQQTGFIG